MNKKLMAGVGMLAAVALMATGLVASAQTSTSTTPTAEGTASQRPMLEVGQMGKVTMRGTIASIGSGMLTVNSWGGAWTVNVPSGAQILPAAANNDLSQFKVGDFVGVMGTVSQSASWTIDATLVRNWVYLKTVNQERKQNERSAREMMKSERPRNYVGTASNLSGSSFTLNAENTAYTVNVDASAKVANRNWATLALSAIQNGDNVRVWGTNASGTIAAQIVRDVTQPVRPSAK